MRRDFFAQQRQIMAQVEEQLARMHSPPSPPLPCRRAARSTLNP